MAGRHESRSEPSQSRLRRRGDTTSKTFASFGYEWNAFPELRAEDEKFWQSISEGLPLGDLGHRLGLDAGCGKGRYTRFMAPVLSKLVGLDGSEALKAASSNLATCSNVALVRADLRDAPFREKTFGYVASLGVLHHLEDPEGGFRALVELLQPGGIILLYLYSAANGGAFVRQVGLWAAEQLRRVTVAMPHRLLRMLSLPIAALLKVMLVVPGEIADRYGIGRLAGLPLKTYRSKSLRALWLDTFDRLSAPVEQRYHWDELAGWFDRAGVQVVSAREDAGWFVVGVLPK